MFSFGRSKYDDKRQIYVNRIIAENLGIKPGEDEVEFVPSDKTGEVRIRKCEKKSIK